MTEKELIERDAKRNIGKELFAAIIDVKAGRHGQVHSATSSTTLVEYERSNDHEIRR